MLATAPLWSAMLARMLGSERLTGRQIVGVLLSIGGIAATVIERGLTFAGGWQPLLGDALLLLSAFCIAGYGLLARRLLRTYKPITVLAYAMFLGSLLLVPVMFTEDVGAALARLTDPRLVALLIFLGAFGGALSHFLWTRALAVLPVTQVVVYINVNPLSAAVLSALLLGEQLSLVFVLGFAAVIAGVLLVNMPAKKPDTTATPREARA
ncbi:MAG: DMT family transporter [Chloroflexaceae bacterium]|nr:DMT family transporter [Chloroflexaceae bacterium]